MSTRANRNCPKHYLIQNIQSGRAAETQSQSILNYRQSITLFAVALLHCYSPLPWNVHSFPLYKQEYLHRPSRRTLLRGESLATSLPPSHQDNSLSVCHQGWKLLLRLESGICQLISQAVLQDSVLILFGEQVILMGKLWTSLVRFQSNIKICQSHVTSPPPWDIWWTYDW